MSNHPNNRLRIQLIKLLVERKNRPCLTVLLSIDNQKELVHQMEAHLSEFNDGDEFYLNLVRQRLNIEKKTLEIMLVRAS